jgi:hypothetical protein
MATPMAVALHAPKHYCGGPGTTRGCRLATRSVHARQDSRSRGGPGHTDSRLLRRASWLAVRFSGRHCTRFQHVTKRLGFCLSAGPSGAHLCLPSMALGRSGASGTTTPWFHQVVGVSCRCRACEQLDPEETVGSSAFGDAGRRNPCGDAERSYGAWPDGQTCGSHVHRHDQPQAGCHPRAPPVGIHGGRCGRAG